MNDTMQVICLGSWHGSDAAAWVLAERLEAYAQLQSANLPALQLHCCGAPAQIVGLLQDAASVVLIDPTQDLPFGNVESFTRQDLERTSNWSSHGLDLVAALDLVDALGATPCALRILALGVGTGAAAPEQVVDRAFQAVVNFLNTYRA